jgi:hypothetical protein
MKKLFTLISIIIIYSSAFSQSPSNISYQAVIRDASNNLITSSDIGLKISILHDSESGSAVYVETHITETNANGLVSIEIGNGSVVSGNITTIDWSDGPYFLKTETDPNGGSSYTITGVTQLLSVPYSLHAKTADNLSTDIVETDPTVSKYSIGDYAHGGIVFWVDETGQHGLVCAMEDATDGITWYNGEYLETNALAPGIFGGKQNTMLIIAAQGVSTADYAAGLSLTYTTNYMGVELNDWYLPSKDELNLINSLFSTINTALTNNGGVALESTSYWSSTEADSENVWSQYLNAGVPQIGSKIHTHINVRLIRAF